MASLAWLLVSVFGIALIAVGVATSILVSGRDAEKTKRTQDILGIWLGNNGILLYVFLLVLVSGLLILLPVFTREAQKLSPLVEPVVNRVSDMARSINSLAQKIQQPFGRLSS